MLRISRQFSALGDAATKIGEIGTGFLEDRLELLALEVQELKIRLAQILVLACVGSVCTLAGLVALCCVLIRVLPPEWRLYAHLACAAMGILVGLLALALLRRAVRTAPMPFSATVEDLKKDVACFSTRN